MKIKSLISLTLFLSLAVLPGCGGGGGGAAGPVTDLNAPAAVTLTPSKSIALANGADTVTITAEVKKADGTAAADGTTVVFSVPSGSGTLSAASAATANGIASVTLASGPIQQANNQTVVVMGTAGGVSGIEDVKFINQPTGATVSIALNPEVANLGALMFKLNNTAGATFDNAAIGAVNTAAGSSVVGNFSPADNSTTIALINAAGFNTGAAPIIRATFAVTGSGLPSFSVDAVSNITALDAQGNAIAPAVRAANMAVAVTFDTEQ